MPELPEVETIRRALAPVLVGRKIAGIRVRNAALRWRVDESDLWKYVLRRRISKLRRRGKTLLIDFEGNTTLLVHLGMSGRLVLRNKVAPFDKHEHVVLTLDDGRQLRYRDPRRFGAVLAGPTPTINAHPTLASLGPEPLSEDFTAAELHQRLSGKKQPIKNALLDQRVLAGLGNIYANEALFRAGISPLRPAGELSPEETRRLLESIRQVLEEALARGGTTLRDYADPNGNAGLFALDLQVYGRAGEACPRCGETIQAVRLAGRSTFWCPRCQG